MVSFAEKQEEIQNKIAQLKAELLEVGKQSFAELSKDIFDKFEHLESFSWRQYTDYFNDGDTCYFGVHADYGMGFKVRQTENEDPGDDDFALFNPDDYEIEEGHVYHDDDNQVPSWFISAANDTYELVSGIDEDIMLDMFGDHVEVTVSRTGVTVDEYTDHD